jgi:hypothetical protein
VPTFTSFRFCGHENVGAFSASPASPMVTSMVQRTGPCLVRSISACSRKSRGIEFTSRSASAFSQSSGTNRQRTRVTFCA